jgi:1,4-dihydroxy-2-naphthoate octaprenyltransferase
VMYVIGFGLIPALAASTNAAHPNAKPWALAAAALLGVGGHFANVLPDLDSDQATGVRGLPQRIATSFGRTAMRLTAFALLLAASCVIVFVPPGPRGWLSLAGLVAAAVFVVVGLRGAGRIPFYAALGVAGIDVILFALREVGSRA